MPTYLTFLQLTNEPESFTIKDVLSNLVFYLRF